MTRNPKHFINFDINFNVTETDDALLLDCYYSTELFDDATMTRLLDQFEKLVATAIGNPEQRVSEFPLMSQDARHQMLVEWNRTAAEYPRDTCIHELFEAQAERTPHAIALVCGTERLAYGELNRRADHLAHRLQDMGVGPEALVGVCAGRSPAMVVGLLAILKAGGAYVPLDPAYPKERLAYILEDTRAPVLLTQDSLRTDFKLGIPDLRILNLDSRNGTSDPLPEANRRSGATAKNLAYVIYTSGSTGRAKGVAIEHRSAVALRYLEQMDYATIEQTLGLTNGALRGILGRALGTLRKQLKPALAAMS